MKKLIKYSILSILFLTAAALVLNIWLDLGPAFRVVCGVVYLLFLPGFVWSWVFWKKDEMDAIERSIISLILSIAFVPLMIFFLNKIGVKIILLNILWEILLIIMVGIILKFQRIIKLNKKKL